MRANPDQMTQFIRRYQPHQFIWLISAYFFLVCLEKSLHTTNCAEEKSERATASATVVLLGTILWATRDIINWTTLGAVYVNLLENIYAPPGRPVRR